jgi:hypothetical protein
MNNAASINDLSVAELSDRVEHLTDAVLRLVEEVGRRGESSIRLLAPKEVADLFSYSKTTVYELMKAGVIPVVQFPTGADDDATLGVARIPLAGLRALIAQHLKVAKKDPRFLAKLLTEFEAR